ncbi:MAG: TerB family tellurite resistance protein [Pseudomonadota bacterium]
MVIANLSEWLFPGDGDGTTAPPAVSPKVGAAGLMVAAAHRDGHFKALERDKAIAGLMKLFHIGNPEAKELIQQAEEELHKGHRSFMTFAVAVKGMEKEDQESLITHLWRLVELDGEELSESLLISSVRDVLGFTRAQAEALRPPNH